MIAALLVLLLLVVVLGYLVLSDRGLLGLLAPLCGLLLLLAVAPFALGLARRRKPPELSGIRRKKEKRRRRGR